jgi:hypothetical protein
MPTQEEIMARIVELIGAEADGPLTPAMESALRQRYYGWIVATKKGNSTSPRDIWESKDGEKMQKQIAKIGKRLAEKKQKKKDLTETECHEACREVEVASACPHCPDDPPPGG